MDELMRRQQEVLGDKMKAFRFMMSDET